MLRYAPGAALCRALACGSVQRRGAISGVWFPGLLLEECQPVTAMGAFGGRSAGRCLEYRHALKAILNPLKGCCWGCSLLASACRLISARWWRIRCAFSCCCWVGFLAPKRHAVAGREAVGVTQTASLVCRLIRPEVSLRLWFWRGANGGCTCFTARISRSRCRWRNADFSVLLTRAGEDRDGEAREADETTKKQLRVAASARTIWSDSRAFAAVERAA